MIFRLDKVLINSKSESLSFRDYKEKPYSRNKICLKTS